VAAATLAFGMIVSTASGYAQQGVDIGKHEYATSCAFCHGESGKGDGLFIKYYNKRAADLTVLQKNNFGVFPFDRVYQVIDGRQALAAHGPADMPVWGDTYTMEAQSYVLGLSSKDLESFVRGRIIALVGYIYTLQAK
jgi:mono/diheme cytochrome c family protein